jgi:hypothetical protein
VDAKTHLPLMTTWKDKEPLIIQTTAGPGGIRVTTAGGGGGTFQAVAKPPAGAGGQAGAGAMQKPSPEELDKMQKDVEAKRAEAEAKRRVVEYRLYYGDYRSVGSVMLPHHIMRAIDGKTTEEMQFESFKVNSKIDQGTFKSSK